MVCFQGLNLSLMLIADCNDFSPDIFLTMKSLKIFVDRIGNHAQRQSHTQIAIAAFIPRACRECPMPEYP